MVQHAILLADDYEEDRILIRRSFSRIGVHNPVYEVSSGQAAIAYLSGEGKYADREQFPFPSILLLDLKMPDKDGFQVLQWIRDKLRPSGLLIVVLSRLDEIKQINRAYALGANSFLSKPGSDQEMGHLVKTFNDYWLLANKGPSATPGKPDDSFRHP